MTEDNPYSAPNAVPFRRGGTRRIIGWIVFALAAILTARIIWIATTWHDLYDEEFNRIVVSGMFGLILMLLGWGLIYSARRAAIRSGNL